MHTLAMTCSAALLNTAPVDIPNVVTVPVETIRAIPSSRAHADALFLPASYLVMVRAMSLPGLAHEMCHAIQHRNGWPLDEGQCDYVQRKAAAWCG